MTTDDTEATRLIGFGAAKMLDAIDRTVAELREEIADEAREIPFELAELNRANGRAVHAAWEGYITCVCQEDADAMREALIDVLGRVFPGHEWSEG